MNKQINKQTNNKRTQYLPTLKILPEEKKKNYAYLQLLISYPGIPSPPKKMKANKGKQMIHPRNHFYQSICHDHC